MNGEQTWKKIITNLCNAPIEIHTIPSNNKEPLWFETYSDGTYVYVQNAKKHKPSTNISQTRAITKKDFLTVYSYYHRWAGGETHLRQEVRLYSRNTAYIFSLISVFEDRKIH